jgi:hypothetical protein
MGNLTAYTAQMSETVNLIYAYHKKKGDAEDQRGYLGASIIGRECERELWYTFRNCTRPEFDGRMYRLFETGDLEEFRFVKELREIGCEVHDVDNNGDQFEVTALAGHFSGHMDGCALGVSEAPATWHVLEFKTHNEKSFAKLKKEGVRASKPEHYAQMMVYMGLTRMTRALYLARDKNTDELYGERVRYDAAEFKQLMTKAERIITSTKPPARISDRPDFWKCRFCDHKNLCHGASNVAVPICKRNCRTCVFATPEMDGDGRWSCVQHNADIPRDAQEVGCDRHLLIPDLVSFADATDAGDNFIEFTNRHDGGVWRHCNAEYDGDDAWTTAELMAEAGPREAPIKIPKLSLVDRYPPEDCELIAEKEGGIQLNSYPGLLPLKDVTDCQDDDEYFALEFDREFLVVTYKQHGNYTAIWRAKS